MHLHIVPSRYRSVPNGRGSRKLCVLTLSMCRPLVRSTTRVYQTKGNGKRNDDRGTDDRQHTRRPAWDGTSVRHARPESRHTDIDRFLRVKSQSGVEDDLCGVSICYRAKGINMERRDPSQSVESDATRVAGACSGGSISSCNSASITVIFLYRSEVGCSSTNCCVYLSA